MVYRNISVQARVDRQRLQPNFSRAFAARKHPQNHDKGDLRRLQKEHEGGDNPVPVKVSRGAKETAYRAAT